MNKFKLGDLVRLNKFDEFEKEALRALRLPVDRPLHMDDVCVVVDTDVFANSDIAILMNEEVYWIPHTFVHLVKEKDGDSEIKLCNLAIEKIKKSHDILVGHLEETYNNKEKNMSTETLMCLLKVVSETQALLEKLNIPIDSWLKVGVKEM